MFIVLKGTEHRTIARNEAYLLLIGPIGTPNTGDVAAAAGREVLKDFKAASEQTHLQRIWLSTK